MQPGCRIEASKSDKFSKGDLVVCLSGWQDYSSQKATQCPKIANDIDLKHYLGALGTNGLTLILAFIDSATLLWGDCASQ